MANMAEGPSGTDPEPPMHMTAMRVHDFGGPEAITAQSMLVPRPDAGEILVRVHACGAGPWDAWIRAGKSVLPQPLPLTLGSDVSGSVAVVGDQVTGFRIGDPVYGVTNKRFTDGYAEYAVCVGAMMAPKPASLTDVEAASVPVIAVTAWQMLFDHARLGRGQSVLVQGAAGNVGRFAVQLAAEAGLFVTAIATDAEAGALRALGAHVVVGRDLATNDRFDAVIDLVGGPEQGKLFRLVNPGGSLISAVAEPDQDRAREAGVRGAFMLVDVRTDVLNELTGRLEDGRLRPFVGTVLPLSEAVMAHRMLDGVLRHAPGKIILSVCG
jgi:NADPH:quinone reductase-like Zn-dependent oxidoreductase